MTDKDRTRVRTFAGPMIAIPFALIQKLGGDLSAAAFLAQAEFFSSLSDSKDGWFDFSQIGPGDDAASYLFGRLGSWESTLGLSPDAQLSIRKKLKIRGLLEEKQKGIPKRLFYRVNPTVYLKFLAGEQENTTDPGNPGNKTLKNQETSTRENRTQDSGKSRRYSKELTKDSSMHAEKNALAEPTSPQTTRPQELAYVDGVARKHGVEIHRSEPRDLDTVDQLVDEFGPDAVEQAAINIAGMGGRPFPSVVRKNLKGLKNEKSNFRSELAQEHGGSGREPDNLDPLAAMSARSSVRRANRGRDRMVVESLAATTGSA